MENLNPSPYTAEEWDAMADVASANMGLDLHAPVPHTLQEIAREALCVETELTDEEIYAQPEETENEEAEEVTETPTTTSPVEGN